MGGILGAAWKVALPILAEAHTSSTCSFPLALRSDRSKGELLFKVGKKILPLLAINPPSKEGLLTVVRHPELKSLPKWVSDDMIDQIVQAAQVALNAPAP